jgi:hypothetical protein
MRLRPASRPIDSRRRERAKRTCGKSQGKLVAGAREGGGPSARTFALPNDERLDAQSLSKKGSSAVVEVGEESCEIFTVAQDHSKTVRVRRDGKDSGEDEDLAAREDEAARK